MNWRVPVGAALLTHCLALDGAAQEPPVTEPAPDASASEPSLEPGSRATPPAPPSSEPPAGPDGDAPAESPEPEPHAEGSHDHEPPPGPPPEPAATQPEDYEEPELPMTPAAPDSVTGHFVFGAGGGYLYPFGRLASNVTQKHQVGPGWALAVDAGIGVARSTVIAVSGQFASLSDGSRCAECKGTSIAVGPRVRYHLVQGLRFDPWLSFGVGYRGLSIDDAGATSSYAGFDWANFRVGGDWYPTKNLGVGPFLELVSGGYFKRPEAVGDLRTYWQLAVGARLALDFPGKLK